MKILITGGAGFIGSHVIEGIIEENKIKKIIILDNLKDGSKKNLKNILTNTVAIIKPEPSVVDTIKKFLIPLYIGKLLGKNLGISSVKL